MRLSQSVQRAASRSGAAFILLSCDGRGALLMRRALAGSDWSGRDRREI